MKLLLALLVTANLFGAVKKMDMNIKLPTQSVLERQDLGSPVAASTTRLLTTNAGASSAAAATVSSFSAQPDVARNIVITPAGTTTDIEACDIIVSGTNVKGDSISEMFTFAANASGAVTGVKAFKSVSSIYWPANCESGGFAATWSVGVGSKLGLNKCMDNAAHFFQAGYAGAFESTRPTVVAGGTEPERNTIQLNTSLSGGAVVAFFVQNFRCE